MKIEQLVADLTEASRIPLAVRQRATPAPVSNTTTPTLNVVQGGRSASASSQTPATSSPALSNFGTVGAKRAAAQQAANVAQNYQGSIAAARRAAAPAPTSAPTTSATLAPTTTPTAAPTATPASKLAGVGKALGKAAGAVGRAIPGAVQGIGNVAAQAVGGAAQTIGAAGGGLVHGYKTARGGQRFSSPTTSSSVAAPTQASDRELDDLRSRLDRIEQLIARRP